VASLCPAGTCSTPTPPYWSRPLTGTSAPPAAAAATGWDALRPTEAKVVDHLTRGRSNPQIAAQLTLSRRTVETHVSHVLRKLDLTSRVDIIVAAADRDRPGLLRR
jgi:DNA-binding NarL/FixJ family response regulator